MVFWLGDLTRSGAQVGAVVLGLALCGVMLALGLSKCDVDELLEQARTQALAECQKERSAATCDTLVETNHEACAPAAVVRGTRHSGVTRVEQNKYFECVMVGIDEYHRRRRKHRAQEPRDPLKPY